MTALMTRPTLAALAVVLQNDHVLLVRRRAEPDAGLWGYPGGHVEAGETVADAACREAAEETTIRARPRSVLPGLDIILTATADRRAFHFYLVPVLCQFESGTPQASDDAADARWVPVADVLNARLELSADVDTVLKAAMTHQDGAVSRQEPC